MNVVGVSSLEALQAGDPQRVGSYVLLGRLGSGGMGRVYLARSPGGRQVAVKVIHESLADDPGFRARFAREVQAARRVSGLFTAAVVDADADAPTPWLATAYVPGPSLSDAVDLAGPLPEHSVIALAAGLAEGLSAIHAAGIVHRGLKPSDVLLAQDGPRIIDFGIGSALGAASLTPSDITIVPAGFTSPEQAEGLTVGQASDIFSLAGVLIYAAKGEGPFGSGSPAAVLYRVVHAKPNLDGIPVKLLPLLKRSLSLDPARRPTATQFLAALSGAYPTAADMTNWLPANIETGKPRAEPPVTPVRYPAAADYYKAVQAPSRTFTMPKLQAAKFVWDSLGPILARGSSAVVFHASVGGSFQALRCYVRNDAASRDRYDALNSYLATHDLSPHVSRTTWLDDAIRVNRTTWPVLTMGWIDGRTLNEHVDFLVSGSSTATLSALAARWRELVALLQLSGFAHGDLEHGNVMVDQDGQLRLVDFDGVWIPQLADQAPPSESGHHNYQHPSGKSWGRWMDTFSALVIYLSLVALSKQPGLWLDLYNSNNLLFAKKDFFPPFTTEVWKQLAALHDRDVDELARRLQECCATSWTSVESLEKTLGRPSRHHDASQATPGRIFISYRRDDTPYPCGWLFDRLTQRFGRDQVFKDIDSIELGDDFAEVITAAVEKCDVLLALIGRQWLTVSDEGGGRRIDNPDDFVRLEIEAAIKRNVRVIPVLVEGVRMPGSNELPASLAALARRQALELSPSHFDSGIQRLLKVLDKIFDSLQIQPE